MTFRSCPARPARRFFASSRAAASLAAHVAAFAVMLAAAFTPAVPAFAADFPSAAPLFSASLIDLDDKPASFAPWKGKPTVVNFWARWCMPCRKEIPEFIQARMRHKGSGVELVGIALEERGAPVREFGKAYDIDYPLLLAKDNGIALMSALGNAKMGLPFTLALDRQGRMVYLKLGPMEAADVDAAYAAASKP